MPILILEGPDAVGKSSHADWLKKHHNARVVHKGIPLSSDWFTEYVEPLIPQDNTELLVLDRWHLGEMVWPKLFGRRSLFDAPGSFALCNRMLSNFTDVEIKVITRKPDAIVNTLMLRGELDQTDNVLKSQEMFIDLAQTVHDVPIQIVDSDLLDREVVCI